MREDAKDAEMRARDAWDETARDLLHAEGARAFDHRLERLGLHSVRYHPSPALALPYSGVRLDPDRFAGDQVQHRQEPVHRQEIPRSLEDQHRPFRQFARVP